VYVYGEAVGETMFYGPGAGELPTATSVVSDLVQVVKNIKLGVNGRSAGSQYKEKKLLNDDEQFSKMFLLLRVHDRAGVLATITQLLAEAEVSLESIIQSPLEQGNGSQLCMITHQASKLALQNVIYQLEQLDIVQSIDSVYRVEG
jgi:homoserine dehydrogenase